MDKSTLRRRFHGTFVTNIIIYTSPNVVHLIFGFTFGVQVYNFPFTKLMLYDTIFKEE
jgi:hypothetical protein